MKKFERYSEDYGICDCCGKYTRAAWRDMGYGAYEYWGARGVHHDWCWVSPCCDADIVEGGNTELSRTVRRARKAYPCLRIAIGERYLEIVEYRWRSGGPGWIHRERIKLCPPVLPAITAR